MPRILSLAFISILRSFLPSRCRYLSLSSFPIFCSVILIGGVVRTVLMTRSMATYEVELVLARPHLALLKLSTECVHVSYALEIRVAL
jgi:hypothetical protein